MSEGGVGARPGDEAVRELQGRIDHRQAPQPEMSLTTRYRDTVGVLRKIALTPGPDLESPSSGLEVRSVSAGGRRLVQKWVPKGLGAANPACYDLLDAEIRALSRLTQAFPGRFPHELACLVGYNVDVAEPFLLLEEYRGRPAVGSTGQLTAEEQTAFQHSLVRALQMTEQATVVHHAVTLSTLRWDGGGRTVQLIDFERAVVGAGAPSFGVDIAAAGSVIRRVVLGPLANGDAASDPQALRTALADVFDPELGKRPTAAVLLNNMLASDQPRTAVDPRAPYATGHAQFDRVSKRKRDRLAPPPPDPPTPPGPQPRRSGWPFRSPRPGRP